MPHGASHHEFWSLHGMRAGFRSEACGLLAGTSGGLEFSLVDQVTHWGTGNALKVEGQARTFFEPCGAFTFVLPCLCIETRGASDLKSKLGDVTIIEVEDTSSRGTCTGQAPKVGDAVRNSQERTLGAGSEP